MSDENEHLDEKKTNLKALGAIAASFCAVVITIANVEEAAWKIRKAWAYFTENANVSVSLEKPSPLNYLRSSEFSENIRVVNRSRFVTAEVEIRNIRMNSITSSDSIFSAGKGVPIVLKPGDVYSSSIVGSAPTEIGQHSLSFDIFARAGFRNKSQKVESEEVVVQIWHEYPTFRPQGVEFFRATPGDRNSVVAKGHLSVGRAASKGLSCSALLEDDLSVAFKGLSLAVVHPDTIGQDDVPAIAKWKTQDISSFSKLDISLALEIDGKLNEGRILGALDVACYSVM